MAKLLDITWARSIELGIQTTLGRSSRCTYPIPDGGVSSFHAEIIQNPGGSFMIRDLQSRNGTYLNSKRVEAHLLVDGDEIVIGETQLKFMSSDEDTLTETAESLNAIVPQISQRLIVKPTPSYRPVREINDPDKLRRNYESLRAAYELIRATSAVDDIDELLEGIVSTAFRLLEADRASIFLVDPASGELILRLARHSSGTMERISVSQTILGEVMAQKAGVIASDATTDDRFQGASSVVLESIRSVMCVPMLVGEDLVGVMHLDSQVATNIFGGEDLELFTAVAAQAGMVVKNATLRSQLHQEAIARQGVEREMEIARRIQTSLLPQEPSIEGYTVAGAMVPAEMVGGDYYDVLRRDEQSFWVAIGDVSSHGVTPGLIMMMAQSIVAALTARDPKMSPTTLYAELNRVLHDNVRSRLGEYNYMTLTLLRHDGNGRFVFAGKHLDIIIRRASGEIEIVPTTGTWLGVLPEIEEFITDGVLELQRGDMMLLHTDGVTEACSAEDVMFEQEGLIQVLRNTGSDPADVCQTIVDSALEHTDIQADDLTVLAIRRD